MSLFDRYPFATIGFGYDKTLPIKSVKRKQPIDNLDREYFVKLPNGERLQKVYENGKITVTLDIGHIWDIDMQKYHAKEWGLETVAHFNFLIDKTNEEKLKQGGLEFMLKKNFLTFERDLDKKATEFLTILKQLGLSLNKSDLYIKIFASEKDY